MTEQQRNPRILHGAGLVIYRVNDMNGRVDFLLLRKRWGDHSWSMPKGHFNKKSENDLVCAFREVQEETGLTQDDYRLIGDFCETITYQVKPSKRIPDGWKTVRLYLARFEGSPERSRIQLSNEHSAYEWASLARARELLESPLRNLVEQAAGQVQ